MKNRRCLLQLFLLLLVGGLFATGTSAQSQNLARDLKVKKIRNVSVIDQHGRKLRFRKDLISGKTVVLIFCSTSDETKCPRLIAKAVAANKMLEANEVGFIFISTDPKLDTPQRLKQFAAENSFTGTLVTGKRKNMRKIQEDFVLSSRGRDLSAGIVVGDSFIETWKRIDEIARHNEIARVSNELSKRSIKCSGSDEGTERLHSDVFSCYDCPLNSVRLKHMIAATKEYISIYEDCPGNQVVTFLKQNLPNFEAMLKEVSKSPKDN